MLAGWCGVLRLGGSPRPCRLNSGQFSCASDQIRNAAGVEIMGKPSPDAAVPYPGDTAGRRRDGVSCVASAITLGLQVEQFGVEAVGGQQLLVVAGFDDAAIAQDENPVGHAHGREAV